MNVMWIVLGALASWIVVILMGIGALLLVTATLRAVFGMVLI